MSEDVRRRRYLQLATAGLAGLAGCSGDSDSRPSSSSNTPPSAVPTSDTPPTEGTPEETTEPAPSVEHDKLIGAQYYPWYWGEEGFGGYFLAGGGSDSWLSATPGTPVLGPYDSRETEIVNQHMRWCLEHGINWWIITGGAPGGPIDRNIREVVFEADYAEQMSFTLLLGFPPQIRTADGTFDFDSAAAEPALIDLFQHWEEHYVTDPNYLSLGDEDRPPLYFWSTGNASGDVTGVFEAARDAVDVNPYVIGGPDYYNQPTDIEYNAATFDAVLDYHSYFPDAAFLENFGPEVVANHRRWRAAAHEYDLDFIPTVTPGFNHTEAPATFRDDRMLPTLERTTERFRTHCQRLRGFGDHDAIVITSFNEWPEYSAIEPSEEFGTQYLDIVAEELAQSEWDAPDNRTYSPLTFEFSRTVTPAESNPESDDSRHLALAVATLRCESPEGAVTIDIGAAEQGAFFTNGVYDTESDNQRTWRWFGGEAARTEIFAPVSGIQSIEIEGRAVTEGIDVTIRTESTALGTMTVTDSWETYSLS